MITLEAFIGRLPFFDKLLKVLAFDNDVGAIVDPLAYEGKVSLVEITLPLVIIVATDFNLKVTCVQEGLGGFLALEVLVGSHCSTHDAIHRTLFDGS